MLTSAPILIVSEQGQRYTVYCDASRDGLGCVLMQSERVVSYGSRPTPILIVPEQGQRYTVYCDDSRDRLGCVLMQSERLWLMVLDS